MSKLNFSVIFEGNEKIFAENCNITISEIDKDAYYYEITRK